MMLSAYAKNLGIGYRTAWNHFKAGKIKGAYQLESGTIIVPDDIVDNKLATVIYSRVSSSQNKANLEAQARRLSQWATINGYTVSDVVKEVGSGLNDNRKKLNRILSDETIGFIIVEHKDRLTRFGFNYIKALLNSKGGDIIVVNVVDNDKEDLVQDFISVITSFCTRIYGQRRSKRKTEKLLENLEINDK
ncbi:IS607 family transposase [Desulforhopalus vacuolatus]|uniref:IS607 family transposase n=1 Tax=Desulforhopalus vacuolatus TaxID=40414 RepID=UPI00196343F6|nr:IS607 family transposase [Desulforhopalus vacuolatus]MBM9520055.1 IS607 family transposase [Desulforhopalus vacuolatus]